MDAQAEDYGHRILQKRCGNHRKKSEKVRGGILLPSSSMFPVRSSGMCRKCTGSRRFLTVKKIRILGNPIRVSELVTIGNLLRVPDDGFPRSRKP
jgi:hypothetical protein